MPFFRFLLVRFFFFSSRRRHTRCALVTGVRTCALPILIVAGETDGIALGVLDQFLIRERHRLHLIERKAGSICTHLHFLVTKRLKDCTALPDDGEQLRRRSSPHIIQLTLLVRSITTGVAEPETTILVLRHERASGTTTSSVSRLFAGRVRVAILLGSLAARSEEHTSELNSSH